MLRNTFLIDYSLILKSAPSLIKGMAISLSLACMALVIGLTVGLLLALGLQSKNRLIRWSIHAYTSIIRGTPMLVQIFFVYYILSSYLLLSPFSCALWAIGMNSGAYVSHIINAGISGVSKGQWEAAQVLGISYWPFFRYIVLPQALIAVLPALINEGITLVKDTSLASLIGVVELYQRGKDIITQTYDSLTIYIALALCYLCMTLALAYGAQLVEKILAARHVED